MKKLLIPASAVMLAGFAMVGNALAASGVVSGEPRTIMPVSGTTMTIDLREDSGSEPVNAIQLNMKYDPSMVEFVSFDTTGSAFEVQAEQSASNGAIRVARGKAGSVTGNQRVTRVVMRAKSAGTTWLTLDEGSALISGKSNTDILANSTGQRLVTIWIPTSKDGAPVTTPAPSATPTPSSSPQPTEMPMPSVTPSPTTTPEPVEEAGSTLPKTGAMAFGGMVGLGVTAYSARAWRKSKRSLKDIFKRPASKQK